LIFTDLIDFPFSSRLKKLSIDDEYKWIVFPEPDWFPRKQFPQLEVLRLQGSFHPQTIIAMIKQAPNVQDLSLVIDGDLFHWNLPIVGHNEVIGKLISSFSCCSQLRALRVSLSDEESVLDFDCQDKTDMMTKRFMDVEKIRKAFPLMDCFVFSPPGKPRTYGPEHIDLNPYISIRDATNKMDSHWNSFSTKHERCELQVSGTKRPRHE
jgi:hypothetical protein